MTYHILKRVADQGGTYYVSLPVNMTFITSEGAQTQAKSLAAKYPNETLYLVQEVGRVAIEPVVTMTLEPPPKGPVMRGLPPMDEPDEEPVEPRTPKAKPRLLIVPDRRATPAELVGHLMVVAEGKIVKNAFGALELADMPLTPEELSGVTTALKIGQSK